jgi:hypothetical protein
MLRGFATINYWTDDMEAAKAGTPSCWASSRTSSTPDQTGAWPTPSSASATTSMSWACSPQERPWKQASRCAQTAGDKGLELLEQAEAKGVEIQVEPDDPFPWRRLRGTNPVPCCSAVQKGRARPARVR